MSHIEVVTNPQEIAETFESDELAIIGKQLAEHKSKQLNELTALLSKSHSIGPQAQAVDLIESVWLARYHEGGC